MTLSPNGKRTTSWSTRTRPLGADLERASIADGDLLDSVDSLVYTYDNDLSYKSHPDLIGARYMEISVFHVKAGHGEEWRKLGKLVKEAHDKAGTSAHWAMYEIAYGAEDGTYIALSADKSMADIDTGFAENKKFMDALGEDGVKQFRRSVCGPRWILRALSCSPSTPK